MSPDGADCSSSSKSESRSTQEESIVIPALKHKVGLVKYFKDVENSSMPVHANEQPMWWTYINVSHKVAGNF